MPGEFPEKWNTYLAMIQKKNPSVSEKRIRAALWATDGSAGMAKTMLALPWKCAHCSRGDDDVEPAHKGWYLVMNAWLCQTCAKEGWIPGPLSKGWVLKDAMEAPVGFVRDSSLVEDIIEEAEAELAAVESLKKGIAVESKRPERTRVGGEKPEGKKVVPEVASVTVGHKKEDETFEVTVCRLSGESIILQCQSSDTVSSLKWKIEEEWMIKRLRQVLTVGEDILDNEEILLEYSEEISHGPITLIIAPEKGKLEEEEVDKRKWHVVGEGMLEVRVQGYGKHRPTWLCWETSKRSGKWVTLNQRNAEICAFHKNPEAIHTGLDADDRKRYREKNYIFWMSEDSEADYPESINLNIGDVLFFAYEGVFGTCEAERVLESEIEDGDVLDSMDNDEFLPFAYVNGKKRHNYPADGCGFNWIGERPNDWLIEGYAVCFKAVGRGITTLSWTVTEPLEDEEETEEEDEIEED